MNTARAEPPRDALTRPWGLALALERALFLGPYTQDGPRGETGFSVAAGPYLRSSDLDGNHEPFLPHAVPRLTFDMVLPWDLTAGIGAGYGFSTAIADDSSGSQDPLPRSVPTKLFTGRFGFIRPIGPESLFWLRLGLAYTSGTGSHTSAYYVSDHYTTNLTHWSLPLDFEFVFPVAKHLALTFAMTVDLGLYGTDSLQSSIGGLPPEEQEVRRVNDAIGFWFGIMAFR